MAIHVGLPDAFKFRRATTCFQVLKSYRITLVPGKSTTFLDVTGREPDHCRCARSGTITALHCVKLIALPARETISAPVNPRNCKSSELKPNNSMWPRGWRCMPAQSTESLSEEAQDP